MFLNTLSGRFLILTVVFVMIAEVLIFVPSIARFRADYMLLPGEGLLFNSGIYVDVSTIASVMVFYA